MIEKLFRSLHQTKHNSTLSEVEGPKICRWQTNGARQVVKRETNVWLNMKNHISGHCTLLANITSIESLTVTFFNSTL